MDALQGVDLMPISTGIKLNGDFFKGVAARLDKELSKGVKEQLQILARVHIKEIVGRGGKNAPMKKDRWTTRTGGLRSSFHSEWSPGDLEGAYGSGHVAARVQEEGSGYLPGGVIRPRKAKALAIPMGPAKTASGAGRPRDFPGLVLIQSLRGQPMLVMPTGDGASFEVYFLLRKQVKLPPRPTLEPALKASEGARNKAMDDAMTRAMGQDPVTPGD